MGCKPQLRIGRPHSGPQQHNWQAYLSLTELCRALGGGIMTLSSSSVTVPKAGAYSPGLRWGPQHLKSPPKCYLPGTVPT